MHDVVFFHPPVSFSKARFPLSGSFDTGTTDLLTMMPLGLLSLANELHRSGLSVTVVNVARLLQASRATGPLDLPGLLAQFPARLYGIDLHWVAHASGALELAQHCKTCYPDCQVILGGLSATVFAEEILGSYPFVDAVVLGECDGHMPAIARALLQQPARPDLAPNIAYRGDGTVGRTLRQAPDLTRADYLDTFDLIVPARQAQDRESIITNIPVVRGCTQHCLFCGGDRRAYAHYFFRPEPSLLPVTVVMDHIRRSLDRGVNSVKLFGDLRCGGSGYASDLLAQITRLQTPLDIGLELFWPASAEFLAPWRAAARDLWINISPESSHPALRRLLGKTYDNQALLDLTRTCRELDIINTVCFAYLLPGHTPQLLKQELDFVRELLEVDPQVGIMLQPYLYLDPGSPLFDEPAEHGFTVHLSTLETLRRAHERAYWYFTIGYHTTAFSRCDFYQAILELTWRKALLYFHHGRLPARDLLKTSLNLDCQHRLCQELELYPYDPTQPKEDDGRFNDPTLTDEMVQEQIERLFPDYLRRSNTNLLLRPFFGEDLAKKRSPAALIYDAFPISLQLLLGHREQALHPIENQIRRWLAEHKGALEEMMDQEYVEPALRTFVLKRLDLLNLPHPFVQELISFEWDIYRLLYCAAPPLDGQVWQEQYRVKAFHYDLLDYDTLAAAVAQEPFSLPRGRYHYVFDLETQEVWCLSFDPRAVTQTIPRAQVRRIKALWLNLITAEQVVLRALARMDKKPQVHRPEWICRDQDLTMDELQQLFARDNSATT